MPTSPEAADGRRVRGDRSRQTITRHAVDVASLEGLNGLSIGRLATDLRMSKSGIATLFGTKEQLQVAVVDAARQAFIDDVVRPVAGTPHGAARLRALIDRWVAYAEKPLFAGGCFRSANMADFDSRPGPVRDALRRDRDDWLSLLARELETAVSAKEAGAIDPELAAFQLDAVLSAANSAMRLGDDDAADKVRRTLEQMLERPKARPRRSRVRR